MLKLTKPSYRVVARRYARARRNIIQNKPCRFWVDHWLTIGNDLYLYKAIDRHGITHYR